ncbi:MAG: EF-P lysine aminoacylase GenX [Candidatus Magasanikbacteria bacterium]|jgi:elongation factor P--(R)-beta-lysine ligase|nr:EF-P lysine aminoacylase GenX [Candidatus Magasanikbacteria bacterium]MBT6252851.1 EF-P lysine aminoacylase GenX [Candidatus Magasanikbacteria bacterium]
MSQIFHIQKQKNILSLRADIVRAIREFFWEKGFLEVEVPLIVRHPGQEPNLSPMEVIVKDERNKEYQGYLHTSPEYALKKVLAAGYTNVFSLGKCFRNNESFGGDHNPEFTMLEWYRKEVDFHALMDDCEKMYIHIEKKVHKKIKEVSWKRLHMRDLWKQYIGVNLDMYQTTEAIFALCKQKGYTVDEKETYEALFYRIFLNEIEPKIKEIPFLIIHHYPKQMASLARISKEDPLYAERFELYIDGVEIANAFSELTDKEEQKQRLKKEQQQRKEEQKETYEVDNDFIDAVGQLPACAGIALGVDRLVQHYTSCKNIDDVLVLPMSKIFN